MPSKKFIRFDYNSFEKLIRDRTGLSLNQFFPSAGVTPQGYYLVRSSSDLPFRVPIISAIRQLDLSADEIRALFIERA